MDGLDQLKAAASKLNNGGGDSADQVGQGDQGNQGGDQGNPTGQGDQGSQGAGDQDAAKNQKGDQGNQGNQGNQVPDFDSLFSEKFGIAPTEFENIKQKATLADQYKAQLDADPYDGNVQLAGLAKLTKEGHSLETAIRYIQMDISKLSPKEKMILSYQLAKPTLSRELIEQQVNKRYNLGDYAPQGENGQPDESQGLADIEFEVAGKDGIEAKLAQQKEELLRKPDQARSEVIRQQNAETLQKDWEKQFPAIENKLKAFELTVEGLKDPIKIPLEGGDKIISALLKGDILKNGHAVNDKNLADAEEIVRSRAIIANLPKIAKEIYKAANGKLDDEHYQEVHNSSQNNHQPKPGDGQGKKGGLDQLQAAAKKVQSGKTN